MASEIIGMFAQVTGGTQDARAQIDIPQDGVILGIDWDASWYFDAEEKAEIEKKSKIEILKSMEKNNL